MVTTNTTKQDIVVKRMIDAPVELVWRAWTEPEHVMRWWGPKDYTSPSCQIDFREGGKYLFCMRAPEYQGGLDYYSGGVYTKIVPMQRLEFTQTLTDEKGNSIKPAQVGMPPDFPDVVRTVIIFKPVGDKTELIITEYDWTVGQMAEYSRLGLEQTLDKLVETLTQP